MSPQLLPQELFDRVLGFMQLSDMLCASHVSCAWRQAVFHHPKFCLDILIDDLSEGSLYWARKRLHYSCGRGLPFDLTIDLRTEHVEIERTILVWICSCLNVVRRLRITLPSIYSLSLWGVIGRAAPNIEIFELVFHMDPYALETSVYHIPPNIFANTAPCLRRVKLMEVLAPLEPITAFAGVTDFSLMFWGNRWQMFPRELFEFMPRLKRLTLAGGRIQFASDSITPRVTSGLHQLEHLDMTYNPNRNLEILQRLDTSVVPALTIVNADEDVVYAALTPLRAPFHITITRAISTEFHIIVYSESTRQIRRFVEFDRKYAAGSTDYSALFDNKDFASQLSSLTLATSLWSMIVPWLPAPYTALSRLIVFIDDPSAESNLHVLPREPLECPGVEVLVFQAKYEFAYVEEEDLVNFVGRLTSKRVELQLHRVLVRRSHSGPSLEGRFKSVSYSVSKVDILTVPDIVSG
ncbi:hypothetical protein EXIGLDRAFT_763627 [Exidia glandulosa HHB12029]|uniref:F-box domain-containing protein n=1 Tax=Exidia glandulosa HHB12029 TaxID=1314781 RepID=A0A165LU13_EXIGL|nr:hypothetical protein EXIGLDRAFT_763627 [Exidia glandulosa HHB12029]